MHALIRNQPQPSAIAQRYEHTSTGRNAGTMKSRSALVSLTTVLWARPSSAICAAFLHQAGVPTVPTVPAGPRTPFSTRKRTSLLPSSPSLTTSTSICMAAPKRGSVVDSYRTVSVECSKCSTKLFRYKKKNGTNSNLVKCYVERICEDSARLLENAPEPTEEGHPWHCPQCSSQFARSATMHGRPALKMVGGKIRMTKK